jgi:hypothetical protein
MSMVSVEDRVMIRDLYDRFYWAMNDGDRQTQIACFVPSGYLEKYSGRDQLSRAFRRYRLQVEPGSGRANLPAPRHERDRRAGPRRPRGPSSRAHVLPGHRSLGAAPPPRSLQLQVTRRPPAPRRRVAIHQAQGLAEPRLHRTTLEQRARARRSVDPLTRPSGEQRPTSAATSAWSPT